MVAGLTEPSVEGSLAMTASYFRNLASRCRKASRECFDLFAKEEFRRLANELSTKADELDYTTSHPDRPGWFWADRSRRDQPTID